jgi:hypothetical protein
VTEKKPVIASFTLDISRCDGEKRSQNKIGNNGILSLKENNTEYIFVNVRDILEKIKREREREICCVVKVLTKRICDTPSSSSS